MSVSVPVQTGSDLQKALRENCPYNPLQGPVIHTPIVMFQVPVLFRVYRDPMATDYKEKPEEWTDSMNKEAIRNRWMGPWELTTWGKLIEEVIRNPQIRLQEGTGVPEEGSTQIKSVCLHHRPTHTWSDPNMTSKEKRAKYKLTPEDWVRDGKLQQVGGVATHAFAPAHREESLEVDVGMHMVMVLYKGVYSVGATISVLSVKIMQN